jgi:catechol 2,3-dioxygenase-like lactoylglutathione lyase family enzyme
MFGRLSFEVTRARLPCVDERPPVWVGHVVLYASDIDRSATFWASLGLREVGRDEHVVIFELRGGTHMVIAPGEATAPGPAPFDLMVEDLDTTRAKWDALGLAPSAIEHGNIHNAFTVTDPDGYVVTVSNSHVVGPV